MLLSFLWWNTSLSPSGRNRSSEKDVEFAREFIEVAIEFMDIDFLALGEISEENIIEIEKSIGNYKIINGHERSGKTSFSTCIIYNPKVIDVTEYSSIISMKGQRKYKIAQKATVRTLNDDTVINIFVSHWPSRLTLEKSNEERAYYGQRLRDTINEIDGDQCRNAHVILMGDYNDEPFDKSLTEHLMSTRERPLSGSRKHMLYNPFWRKLGQDKPYSHENSKELTPAGTCYYASDQYSRWKTFDQIIFSSSFVGGSSWHLEEDYTKIVSFDYIKDAILERNTNFDHLPVISAIRKVQENGQL
ncbi:endonuclease/exonuclease/phosphatase family protein [Marinobacter nauticus]|uniref:endonuclease/exonuclease/phosphatase family protein n=1 Tax=Marinobacter nauticus TaxID=2743 RepID=UPI004043D027